MCSWAGLCCIRFGNHLASLLRERTLQTIHGDRSLTNIYYIVSSTWSDDFEGINHQLFDSLASAVDPNKFIVYSLNKKDFYTHLWQSSSRLAVIFEDPEKQRSAVDFSKEYDLISEFIADGGQVLLMLKKPVTSLNLGPTSLGRALWSGSLARSADIADWHWRLRVFGAAQSLHQPVLLGETMLESRRMTKLVVLSIEQNGPTPEVFHESLEHLGIDRVPINGIHPSEQSQSALGTPSNPIPLYSLILRLQQRTLLDLLFPPNEMVQLGVGTHYTLHCFTELDNLPPGFAWSDYVDALKTRNLGRTMIWTETMESSWDFCLSLVKNLPADSGVLVVSNQQTSAKGRGDNKWISPCGQASFTFHLTLTNPLPSSVEPQQPFPSFVTCLQHLVALSVVLACRQLIAEQLRGSSDGATNADEEYLSEFEHPGSKILIKWPNDVYVTGHSHTAPTNSDNPLSMASSKLAGILTRCTSITGEHATFVVGVGLNVSNPFPTICLQQVLDLACSPVPAKEVSPASVIATVMNRLERLLARSLHSSTDGLSWAMKLYTSCWIHSNQSLAIQSSPSMGSMDTTPLHCTVIGVDSFGYLRVRDQVNGAEYSLHPDGNSMDMMRGLIIPK